MKLSTTTERMSSNFDNKKEFTIKASSKAFDILINAMYTHKVRAIIRELSTNAYDAHVEAGQSKPFEVKLPTRFDPEFYIRDFGTGMTEDKVYNLYTVLFDSDKSENNDMVGCLGIGSKSPFSYCKQFTVQSYINGEAKVYSVYLDETGTPCITKVAEGPTTEENGLKVSLHTKNDWQEFYREAQYVFEYFKQIPTLINGPTITPRKYELSGSNWDIKHSTNVLVMGNVCYELERHYDKLDDLNKFLGLGVRINAEIGDVDIHPSRERLQNTTKTISFLKSVLSNIRDTIQSLTQAQIDKADSLYDANIIYRCLSYKGFIDDNLCWKGLSVKNYEVRFDKMFTVDNKPSWQYLLKVVRPGRNRRTTSVIPQDNLMFVINDLKTGGYSRFNELGGDKIYYLVNREVSKEDQKIADQIQPELDKAFNDFGNYFNIPAKYIIYASSLPKKVITRAKYKRGKVLKITSTNWVLKHATSNIEIDETTEGYYVLINGYDIKTGPIEKHWNSFYPFLDACSNNNIKYGDLYAIKEKSVDKFPKLKPLYDYVKTEAEKKLDRNVVKKQLTHADINSQFYGCKYAKLIKDQDIQKLYDIAKNYSSSNHHKEMYLYNSFRAYLDWDIKPDKIDYSCLKKYEDLRFVSGSDDVLKKFIKLLGGKV